MNPLEPGQLKVMRVQAWSWSIIALIVSLIAEVVNSRIELIPSGIVVAVVVLLLIYPALVAPGKVFHSWSWKVDTDELHLHHGVWTKVETIVPFRRVQHLDVSQGALQRIFGVTSLVIHTAGALHSRVVLQGLLRETAEAIRDEARNVIVRDTDEQ